MTAPTILSVLATAVYMMLALYPLASGPATRAGRLFLALTLLLGTCSAFHALAYSAHDAATAWRWFVFGAVAWSIFTPLTLLLPLELARSRPLPHWTALLIGLPAVITFVVTMTVDAGPQYLARTPSGWVRDLSGHPAVWNSLAVVLLGYILVALGVIAWWLRHAPTRRERHQAAWLLGSGAAAISTALVFMAIQPLSSAPEAPRVYQVFGVIWAAGYAIAIFRHRLIGPSVSLAAKAILSHIQDLVFVVDEEGRLLEANSRAQALLEIPLSRLRGTSVGTLFDPPEAVFQTLDRARVPDGDLAWVDAALRVHSGQPVPVTLMFAPIIDDFTDRLGFVGIAQDQRPMREALKAERIATVGLLAGGIAHDFNNLLTAIGGNIELARTGGIANSTADRQLVDASRACGRAQGLTQQLLTFSRGGAPIRKATSLVDILHDSSAFATSGSRVRAEVSVPNDLWLVDADGGQIAQVIHNLTLNAVQAMPEGGTLTITACNIPSGSPGLDGTPLDIPHVRLTIIDQGHGIPPELLARICEPFFSTKPDGSGLGLATCYSIVHRHEGSMMIDSKPGGGTTVRVDLRRAKRPSDDLALLVPRPPRPGGRALVMDDQVPVEAVACEMLGTMGWKAVGTHDGDEAVDAFLAAERDGQPFDLVLLDLTVPGGIGGIEAVVQMRSLRDDFYAVVSSGYGEESALSAPGEHGFDDVLPKPYSCSSMREMVARFDRHVAARAGTGFIRAR